MNPFTVAVSPFIFLSISAIALFSFLAVAAWSGARSTEREAYYKSETIRKIAESPEGGTAALQYLREQQAEQRKRDLEKHRGGSLLGGLVTAAIGIGVMVFLGAILHNGRGFILIGLIPLLIGIALVAYAQLFAPKE